MVNEPDEVKPKAQPSEGSEESSADSLSGGSDLPAAAEEDTQISSDSSLPGPTAVESVAECPPAEERVEEGVGSDLASTSEPTSVETSSAEAGSVEGSCLRDDLPDQAGLSEGLGREPDPEESHYAASGPKPEPVEEGSEEDEEDGGGPVKTFLEHLEDLRWTIIRCLVALAIAVVVCLIAGNMVVDLLKEPLRKAQRLVKRKNDTYALIQFGTNKWVLDLESNVFGPLRLGSNNSIKLVLVPAQIGTNVVLALNPAPLDRDELPPVNQIELKNLSPVSPFVVAIKIAVFGGLGLSSPFLLLFIGQFVVPALKRKEKKYLYRALGIGSALFCAGVLFCYFFMLQIALNAAVQFSKWMGFGADIWRAEDYIGFVVKFLVGMGLSFELPVVLLTLVKLELMDYQSMNKFRPYWVVVNLVIAAILTPPDVVSQMLMAIPLQLLYELSVLIAWYWYRRDQKRLAALGT